jgi:hypothetical protein
VSIDPVRDESLRFKEFNNAQWNTDGTSEGQSQQQQQEEGASTQQ